MVQTRLLALVGLAAALAAGCGRHAGPAPVGERFPQLRLAALDAPRPQGEPVPVLVPAGRDVVINVWATWCGPCRDEMASLARLAREAPEIEVVGLSVDADANLAREFVLKQGVRFANFSDPGGRVADHVLGVKALPHTFVVSRDGTLVARVTGPRDWADGETRRMLKTKLAAAGGTPR